MRRLDAKVALITGGASGIGAAIARRLASEGASVIITDTQEQLGRDLASTDGLHFMQQDVCEEDGWIGVVEHVEHHFGQLDILVNNAGILGSTDIASPENTSLAEWRKIFAVNVEGSFLGCRAVIPAMRRTGSGSIVNLSSMADRLATPQATAYGASKAAVRQLTRSVAQYCAQQKLDIRCNSVHPGMVRTPLLDKAMQETARRRGISLEDVIARSEISVPVGELTRPEDIAAAVAFLASPDAAHITGSALLVDGGIVNCNTYHRRE